MISHPLWVWGLFFSLIVGLLALDLGIFNKRSHKISFAEALGWSGFWISLALLFNAVIYFFEGGQAASEFFTAYILEKSLSVDNLFVFLVVFSFFGIAEEHRHRVLYWGILGAIVLRCFFIVTGVALLHYFEWMIYVFGVLLLYTAWKLAKTEESEINPAHNPALRFFKRYLPFTDKLEGKKFFTVDGGKHLATPMLACLIVIEMSDVMFAADSIPAVLAVSKDPFIVFTSNIFAILGLRSLYFALEGLIPLFRFLKQALVVVLAFIGIKMLLTNVYHIPTYASLSVVGALLGGSVLASLLIPKREAIKTC